jgi:hypothetical protein
MNIPGGGGVGLCMAVPKINFGRKGGGGGGRDGGVKLCVWRGGAV